MTAVRALLLGVWTLSASAVAAVPAPGAPPPIKAPPDQARANHDAILRGENTLFDLTPAEQDAVRAFDRRQRAQPPPDAPDAYERCIDQAYAALGREPTAADAPAIEAQCR